MMNGWMPQTKYVCPPTLEFHDSLTSQLISGIKSEKIAYLGPRFVDTLQLHEKYGTSYNYVENPEYKSMKEVILRKQRTLQKQINRPSIKQQDIQFDSDFESGNLDIAIRVSDNEYDLFMRVDSNTKGHQNWFYFTINSLKFAVLKINICNFTKKRQLYERGLRPYIKFDKVWQQGGDNVTFKQKEIRYGFVNQTRVYYQLSFDIAIEPFKKIEIAYSIPYTYTKLLRYISRLQVKKSILTKSVSGLDVPIIEIGKNPKKVIIITGRVHPGESNSSFVLQGFINRLLIEDPQSATFKIIPMLNPDGVVMGNFRTCVTGFDLNRQYHQPDPDYFPTIHALKQLVYETHNVYMYLDFHGHSIKKNCFIYGPEYPIFSSNYLKSRMLAKLISLQTDVFRYFSGIWRINRNKKTTARAIFNWEKNIIHCFTIETSLGLYYIAGQLTREFKQAEYVILGSYICQSVFKLILMETQFDDYQMQRVYRRKLKLPSSKVPDMISFMKQIKREEEQHVPDQEELIQEGKSDSESSQDDCPKKIIIKSPQKQIIHRSSSRTKPARQSFLLQEIECRKGFILEPKTLRNSSMTSTPRYEYQRSMSMHKQRVMRLNYQN